MKNVSFIIPCFNSEATILAVIDSLIRGNLQEGDEIVICDDGSTDLSWHLIMSISENHKFIKIFRNSINLGGSQNRNRCIENSTNDLIFCLDSDNYLYPGSVSYLRSLQAIYSANAVAFSGIKFCKTHIESSSFFDQKALESSVTHSWNFRPGPQTLDHYLESGMVAGASGNYLFTKKSWHDVGGYPPYAHALDTWAFGLKQSLLPGIFLVADFGSYLHTYGHNSYWTRLGEKRLDIMNMVLHETAGASYVDPAQARRLSNTSANVLLELYKRDPASLEHGKTRLPSSTIYSYNHYVRQRLLRIFKSI